VTGVGSSIIIGDTSDEMTDRVTLNIERKANGIGRSTLALDLENEITGVESSIVNQEVPVWRQKIGRKNCSSFTLLQVFQVQIFLNLIHRQSCEVQKQA
jgi:hypothetical protein